MVRYAGTKIDVECRSFLNGVHQKTTTSKRMVYTRRNGTKFARSKFGQDEIKLDQNGVLYHEVQHRTANAGLAQR